MMDLRKITDDVRQLAIETGSFLREEQKRFRRECVVEKHAHDYVSYVDKESERRIVERLHQIVPQAGFIAEEGTGSLSEEEYCWVVDPLDGTTNYIHGSAPFCVSIALRNREELLVGVVYEVSRNECFYAWKDSEAYLNGTEIHVSNISSLNNSFIQLGLPYNAEKASIFMTHLLYDLYGHVGGIRIQGSAAAELCYIAAGRFEARIEGMLGPWDIAAGALILKQAGGNVTTFTGTDDFYNGQQVLATNGAIHGELQSVVHNNLIYLK